MSREIGEGANLLFGHEVPGVRERALQHQPTYEPAMLRRIRDRARPAERASPERELVRTGGADDGIEVEHERVVRYVVNLALGQASAAHVEAHDAAATP